MIVVSSCLTDGKPVLLYGAGIRGTEADDLYRRK